MQCGESLEAASAESAAAPRSAPPPAGATPAPSTTGAVQAEGNLASLAPFLAVFGGLLAVGTVVAILIMRQLPARDSMLGAAPAAPAQTVSADGQRFPPGHPQVQLPKEALDFINQVQRTADANSRDLVMWNRLGDVTLRAAAFDPSYYPRAAEAYAHVLKIDPDNLDALRGTGNIDFDQRKFDRAIAAYEHYLSRRPDDPDVRTDLGTMYLSTNNADQAVLQYRKVLERHPAFFEADFNLGVAYGQMNRRADARAALNAALKVAPDADARTRVNQMLASLESPAAGDSGAANAVAGSAPPAAQFAANTTAPDSGTFQGAMEQMLRDLPIAGPKVQSVQWPASDKARVLMDNFPMDQMPPFAAKKFLTDLKSGIDEVKSAHKIANPVEIDICDAASGRVMQSVTQ